MERPMTKTSTEMTFTPEALKAVLDQAVAEAVAAALGNAAANGSVPRATILDGRTEASLKLDILVVKAFKRAGYGEVTPRQDVMTYNKWLSQGFRVKPGEKATKVKQFRLFHKSQVEFIGEPSKAVMQAEADAAKAATPAKASNPPTIMQRLKGKTSAQASLPV
jgi:hypothetical protein